MEHRDPPAERPPPPEAFASVFSVAETRRDGDRLLYVGEPLVGPDTLERQVWPLFREHGYEVRLTTVTQTTTDPITGLEMSNSRHALVAEPRTVGLSGIPWTNVVTFLLTVVTTLFAGTMWFYQPVNGPLDLLAGWPFALAVMGVLGVHELGHYALSRYHDVEASLPYFIPVPTFIGTLGAVIRMKGRIPDRRALFDIGVAGPLAGLAATIVVTVVGLYLPPIHVPEAVLNDPNAINIEFGFPPLLLLLSWLTGQPLSYADPTLAVNPVVFGGWIGMFVTFLNLIPVGQLDGGHLVRSMVGRRQETLAAIVPLGLFGLSAYLYFVQGMDLRDSVLIWTFWGIVSLALARAGPATPIYEEPLDPKRMAVGVLTFVLGALCFTPVPFELLSA